MRIICFLHCKRHKGKTELVVVNKCLISTLWQQTTSLKSLMPLCLPIGLYQLGVHSSANINNILLDIDLIWIFGMTKIKKTRGPASNGALWNNYKRGTLCPRKNSVTSCESFLIRICFLLLLYSLLGYRLLNCLPKNVRQVA